MFTLTCQAVSQSVSHIFAALFHSQVRDCLLGLHVPLLMPESLRESNKRVFSLCEETSPVPKRSKTPVTLRMIVLAYESMLLSAAPPRHRDTSPHSEQPVPESTARLLKKQYLMELKNKCRDWRHTGGEKSPNESAWSSPSTWKYAGWID